MIQSRWEVGGSSHQQPKGVCRLVELWLVAMLRQVQTDAVGTRSSCLPYPRYLCGAVVVVMVRIRTDGAGEARYPAAPG